MKRFDYILFLSGAALAVAGFFEIFSTADTFHFVTNQLAAFLAGVLLFFFFAFFFTSRHFVKLAPVLYGISLLLLVIVLKRGVRIRGSLSWLTFGKYSFQPAELMKFSVLLVVSSYLEKKHKYLGDLKLAGVLFFIFLIPILLILKQPDMGSSLIFLSFFFFYLYASGISYIFIILFVIFLFAFIAAFALNILLGISLLQNILVFAAALAVFFLLTRIFIKFIFVPGVKRNFMLLFVFFFVLGSASGYGIEHFLKQYQKKRILVFLAPGRELQGMGYQVKQSQIALGSGRLWGKGFGKGTQVKLGFLPSALTDFIFSAVGEEFGFLGAFGVLFLYTLIMFKSVRIAFWAESPFGSFMAGGIAFYFFIHFFVNIGMNLGFLPVIGIPLPFLSRAGSSMAVSFAMLGVLSAIRREKMY